jgi:hypothetical protein
MADRDILDALHRAGGSARISALTRDLNSHYRCLSWREGREAVLEAAKRLGLTVSDDGRSVSLPSCQW